uniref:ATP synthase epsilon chain, sodium ion specific n=1 Tax=Propionigenium modestum TaxID=2333 RepID=ATPE_PROMO|nr:RecName: Full=ATP synthase epsilon chain, sodium ion specific; AltName: Full=F-ATPase epsilon subunit, sodium ion specific; AltName: Full=Na(+)-translocating ATPase subunit epsilon [Propionigenium modestum]CAA41375.1 F1 subunit [Propionigenium modestum]
MATFKLEVVTPLKKVLDRDAEMVIMRTIEGDMGVMADHAPFVAELAVGEMKIKSANGEEAYFVSGGFLEISKEKTMILADEAIDVKEIDVERAKREAEIAKETLVKLKEDKDIAVTQKSLQEALTKVRIAEQYMHHL